MKTPAYWLLRRFAGRALRVLERHISRAPALSIYDETLAKSAQAFIEAHDLVRALRASVTNVMVSRSVALDQLFRNMRAWSAVLGKDLPGFDRSEYGDNPNVPEDLIDDAQSILALLDKHEESGAEMPFYTATLREDLTTLIEAAKADLAQGGTQRASLSDARTDLKTAAVAFHRDLVAFRIALRALVGSNHPDYQKLRVARGGTPDVDDDIAEDLPEGEHVDPEGDDAEEPTGLEVVEEAS